MMDPLRQSDSYPGRYSLTQDVTIQAEGGHQMTFDDSLRSSLGPVGDPMLVSTGRKIRKDQEDSMTSSQMSVASVQSTSSLGILQLDSMGDLSTSLLQLDGSFNPSRFSNGFLDGQESHTIGTNSDFEPGERGKATGVESIESSEIDTEDELETVRRENARRNLYPASPGTDRHALRAVDGGESSGSDSMHYSRPCLEGGSSDGHDSTLPSSPWQEMSLRQSAEGEVVTIPGDGGGGGDGMSDGETESSLTAPSVVSGGAVGGRLDGGSRRVFFRSWSTQSGYSDQERNVEGSVLSDPQQTPVPEVSRLAHHFLLPSAHPHLAGSAADLTNSPEPRPLSSASSLHFEEGAFGSSQEGLHQRFWSSGMLEGASMDEDRRGNGTEEDEDEDKDGEKTLIGGSGDRWSSSLREFEYHESDIHTERDILQIQQMMHNFQETSPSNRSTQRAYNPFDSMQDDNRGSDLPEVNFSEFDGEFMVQDDAEALLEEDQKEFEKENEFREVRNMSISAAVRSRLDAQISSNQFSDHNASEWTPPDKSHMTLDRSEVVDDECFDERVSLGGFMRTRTEALGSLSGDYGTKRPSFGTGHIKTPEGKEPVALVEMPRLSLVSEEQGSYADRVQGIMGMEDLGESIRFAGVGSDTEDQHAQRIVRNESALQRVSQLTEDSSSSFAELDEYSAGKDSLPMASLYLRVASPEGSASNDQQLRPRMLPRSASDHQMAALDLGDLDLADGSDDDGDDDPGGVSRFIRNEGSVDHAPIAETPDASQTTPPGSPLKPNLKVQLFQGATPMPPRQIGHLREESELDGTRTPPVATSSIAAAIISASSCTKPEELAAMIVALSNKNRKLHGGQAPEPDRTEAVNMPKPVDAHSGSAVPNQVPNLQHKSPKSQRNNYSEVSSEKQESHYMNFGQDSKNMPREAVPLRKSSKNISGAKPVLESHYGRTQPSGTDSEPQRPRGDKFPVKYPESYKSKQAFPSASQQEIQERKSEEGMDRRPRSSSNGIEKSVRNEKFRDSSQGKSEAASKIQASTLKMASTEAKQSVGNAQRESLENSIMKEIVGLELSFDSRMKVHAERIKIMQRAQEVEDGTRQAGRDSLESVDNDTLVYSPRYSVESHQDSGKMRRLPDASQENTEDLAKRLSSDNKKDLKYRTQRGPGRMEDLKIIRVPSKSDKYRDVSPGSQRNLQEIHIKNGNSRKENYEDLLKESDDFRVVASRQQPSKSPSKREPSHFQGMQKAGRTKSGLSGSKSPERNEYGLPRDGRHEKNAVLENAHRRDYSSDDENDDLLSKRQSWNDHKSSRQESRTSWKHEPVKLSHSSKMDSRNDSDNKRTLWTPEKKTPSPLAKQVEKSTITTDDHGQGKTQLECNLDPNASTRGDNRLSASPKTTPTANNSSSSLCSASSSLSESATQTSDDDSRNTASAKTSEAPTSLSYGPPITSFQAFPTGPHVSTLTSTTPTLLTSQSLLTNALLNQYLNEQAVTSRPANTLSVAPSYVSGQLMRSLDAAQRGATLAPPSISQSTTSYLAPQSSNLGLTQTLTINTGQNAPSLNQLQSLDPSFPPNTAAVTLPLPSSTCDLGPMLDRVSVRDQLCHLDSGVSYPPSYPTSATMPVLPLQSTHTMPPSVHGFSSLSASNFAALPGFQGAVIPGYPVSAMSSRPGTVQEHAPPQPTRVCAHGVNPVVVGSVNIKGVCCLGIAKQALLPLQNPGQHWLQCHLEVVSVSINGEELPPDSLSSFLVKRRTIISPRNTEEVKVVFVPRQPGIYVAQVLVSSSPVVAEGEVAYLNQGVPVTLLARAEKPNIGIKGAQNGTLDLGVLSYGKERSAPIYLINKGSSTVPLRLLIKVNSSAWHSFYLHTGESRASPDSASSLNLPTHVTLEGQNDTTPLWVHFRATQRDKASSPRSMGSSPEQVSAKLEVWLDVPDGGVPVTSVALRATVGLAKLNIPRALTKEITLRSSQGEHTGCMLPLKNTGNIHLDMELTVISARELFNVVPQAILLAPGQEVDVLIKYTPKEVPSFDTGQLTMCARPDGPSYEVTLCGEAVEKSPDGTKPNFLVNRHYISWGGVPIGRALQQKLTIRSCSKTEELKFKLYITGNKHVFQLLNTFKTGEWSTDDSQYVTVQPQEDLPVHILFSPTTVDTSQAKLSIKPQGNNFKYTVPLSGYGGVSKLIVENVHETEHGCYSIDVGKVITKRSTTCTVTVSNIGRRSAFVKALGFQDEQGRDKLSSSRLLIDPPEFILPEKRHKTLTVTLDADRLATEERRGAREGLLAGVGLFYGDEISRQQYRRALRHRDSEAVSLSEHNPLRGISLDRPIPGEAKVNEVCDLPWRSGDLNLFYRCISRVMLLLTGSLCLDNPTAATKRPVDSLSPLRSSGSDARGAENKMETMVHSNRPVTVSYTPPIKGTPAPRGPASSAHHARRLVSPTHLQRTSDVMPVPPSASVSNGQGNGEKTESWNVLPQQLVLTAPGAGVGVQKSHSIRIANLSVRKLRFETMHTPDCLIVTPAAGMVEPMRQLLVLVSCNPSIQAKGVQLPWSGAILVICDGQQQEVRVQIREDFGMDTSIVPSMGKMQSLPDQPATPDASMAATPAEGISPVKLQSKVVCFPGTKVGSTSEATLEFQNKTSELRQWCLSSFAPTYVKQDNGEIYRATYSAFRFTSTFGNLEPGQNNAVHLEFIPRDKGAYSQYWDLESSGKRSVAKSSHKTRIELMGQGVGGDEPPQQRPKKKTKDAAEDTLVRVEPLINSKHGTAVHPNVGDNASEGDVSPEDTRSREEKKSADSTSAQGIVLIHEHLVFSPTKVGSKSTLKVQIQNTSQQIHTLKFLRPHEPFFIGHHQHTIQPNRFIRLPVSFKPTAAGKHQAALVIETTGHHSLLTRLEGIAV